MEKFKELINQCANGGDYIKAGAAILREYNLCSERIKEECKKKNSLERWLNGDKTIEELKRRKTRLEKLLKEARTKERDFNRRVNMMIN